MSAPKTESEWGIRHAESTVLAYASYAGLDMGISEENISSLLTDLMRLAEQDGHDFAELLQNARTGFEREVENAA